MKSRNFLNFIFIFIFTLCFSQQHKFMSHPGCNEADLKKEHSAIEKDAPAEILYTSVRYNITGTSAEKTFYSKIKIYDKKKSEEWLNIEIPVMTGEVLSDFEINVYNYNNDKTEKITLNRKDQLKENIVKGLRFYKVAVPNILDGSVIEYSYQLNTGIFNMTYYLQYSIPVVYQEYNLEYPDTISYFFNSAGNLIRPSYHVSSTEDRLSTSYNIYRFGYNNIKSVPKEEHVKNLDRYRARIKPELTKYSSNYFTYTTSENWSKAATRLNENEKFGGSLRNNVKDILPENIKTIYKPLDRANKIFDFVKNNYKWNKQMGYMASQNLRQTVKTKSGNAADINLLLICLLKDAGLKANPFLISTVDNGILNIMSPNLNNLNLVLASVNINNEIYFYDATSFSSRVNVLPERDWNDFGILIEGDKGTDISFSNTNISKKEFVTKAEINPENMEVIGTITKNVKGLYAIESYDEYDMNKEKFNQRYKSEFQADISEVESKLLDNGDFESKMKFSSNNVIDAIGNKILLNPSLFLSTDNEKFNQEGERVNKIDFVSAFTKEKKFEITIPDGYKIGGLPTPKKIRTDDNELSYQYTIDQKDNKILITSKIEVADSSYPKEYYPLFKQFWKIMSENESQVISLIKN